MSAVGFAAMALPHERAVAVLGHFPDYVRLGEELGARLFTVPEKVWNRMSAAEQWAANRRFLDRTIARGDDIILATPAHAARPGSYYARELEYLRQQGYRVSEDGTRMVKPH